MNIKEAMEKMKTDEEMTFGETLGPAMKITDPKEANEYLRIMIERGVRLHERTREDAEKVARGNLCYYAGYYGRETRIRANQLFGPVHPVFGSDFPTEKEALQKGLELGEASKRE